MHLFKNNQAAMLSLFDCIFTYFPLPILIKKGEILPWQDRVPQKFTIQLLDSIKYLNFHSDPTVDYGLSQTTNTCRSCKNTCSTEVDLLTIMVRQLEKLIPIKTQNAPLFWTAILSPFDCAFTHFPLPKVIKNREILQWQDREADFQFTC